MPEVSYDKNAHAVRYRRVNRVMPEAEWLSHFPLIAAIERLKPMHNAVILAHNYQAPEIFHGVADFQGDSLALARYAARSAADVIVVCGVRFMAETVKLLCLDKIVLLPDIDAGCSLADSITVADIRLLRERYPGVPVVCYVNTSAAVKAECDICCTSANAVAVVESLHAPRVILVPDRHLAGYVARHTAVDIVAWRGDCDVHQRFDASSIAAHRAATQAVVLAHPECSRDVQAVADYVGSTSGMIETLTRLRPTRAMLITERTMSDNVASQFPEIEFSRPCNLCSQTRRITLAKIHTSLEQLSPFIELPAQLIEPARRSIERMLAVA